MFLPRARELSRRLSLAADGSTRGESDFLPAAILFCFVCFYRAFLDINWVVFYHGIVASLVMS